MRGDEETRCRREDAQREGGDADDASSETCSSSTVHGLLPGAELDASERAVREAARRDALPMRVLRREAQVVERCNDRRLSGEEEGKRWKSQLDALLPPCPRDNEQGRTRFLTTSADPPVSLSSTRARRTVACESDEIR